MMATTDTTMLILKMLQYHADTEDAPVNGGTASRRSASWPGATPGRQGAEPTCHAETTQLPTEHFPSLKVDFKEFSGEPEDWNTWSRVHQAQLSALGCAEVLSVKGDHDIKIGGDDFHRSSVDPERLRTAHQAWVSLITTCKKVALDIVQRAESPGEARRRLVQHYRANGLKERRRLTVDSCTIKMELGEHPRTFLLRVDQRVKKLEGVELPVDPKNVDIVILSGLTPQYDAEVRMHERSSD